MAPFEHMADLHAERELSAIISAVAAAASVSGARSSMAATYCRRPPGLEGVHVPDGARRAYWAGRPDRTWGACRAGRPGGAGRSSRAGRSEPDRWLDRPIDSLE